MDSQQFREAATSTIDESECWTYTHRRLTACSLTSRLVIHYFDNLASRDVVSSVEPGYLRKLLPSEAPQEGESWADIHKDLEAKIMPGITHW